MEEEEEEEEDVTFAVEMKNLLIKDTDFRGNKSNNNYYFYYFVVCLIQSLISLGCFWFYYIIQFSVRDLNKYRLTAGGLISLYLIVTYIIYLLCKSGFNSIITRTKNCILFILINFNKILFEIIIYLFLIIGADINEIVKESGEYKLLENYTDHLEFPQFEARCYWKISICFFHLMLIFYFYFKKNKNDFKLMIILIFSFIDLAIFFLLAYLTQKSSYHYDRILVYFFFCFFELFFLIYGVYCEKKIDSSFLSLNIKIDWKINRIDFIRNYSLFFLMEFEIKMCYNDVRCCHRIINNYK